MLLTLAAGARPERLIDHLTRHGYASRTLQEGRALLVADPLIPYAFKQELAGDPDVVRLEETEALPTRVLRGETDPALPALDLGAAPIIGGPCAIESRAHANESADFLSGLGLKWMRGGTDKTRTSPRSFQGAGLAGALWLKEAAERYGMRCVSEVTDAPEAEAIADCLDLIQVGARNMHNPRFLQRLGRLGKPILLKRGLSATPEEWLWAAEYALDAGAPYVIFCERGIRTASPLKRFTLDLGAVPFIQAMTPFPIWVDPSHAAGSSPYVAPLAKAAHAAGASALLVECHPDPAKSCSDATQALDFEAFATLVDDLKRLNAALFEKAGAR